MVVVTRESNHVAIGDRDVSRKGISALEQRPQPTLLLQVLLRHCMLILIVLIVNMPKVISGFSSIADAKIITGRRSSIINCHGDRHTGTRQQRFVAAPQSSREGQNLHTPSSIIKYYRSDRLYSSASNVIDDDGGVESYGNANANPNANSSNSLFKGKLLALYKFTRPHTIRGTILASICGTVRALRDTPHWWTMGSAGAVSVASTGTATAIITILRNLLPRAMIGMVALLFGNAFIVGINQIYDQSIDKMNKPFLPIVSGEMNTTTAWGIVVISAIIGPILVYTNFPTILFQLYTFGLFLGLIYSVPPIRTKQNPILAGLTIACVRGLLLNFGVYYAVKDTFVRGSFNWSPHVSFMARFMTIFASIIAITKDLPDIEGDKANQIETFVTKFGIANIARGASGLLFCNYIHAIITGIVQRSVFAPIPMIGGHVILACMLVYRYQQLQPNSMPSVKRFYKHIWDLFYLEYGLYTLI